MNMYREQVTIIKPSNEKFLIHCSVSDKLIITQDVSREIIYNDIVERRLSNGVLETYKVLDAQFYEGMNLMKATYEIKVEKCNIPKKNPLSITIDNSPTFNNTNNNLAQASNENVISISTLSQLSAQISQSTAIENKQEIQNLISQFEDAKDSNDKESYFDLFFKLLDKLSGSGLIPEWLVKSAKLARNFLDK